MAISSHFFHLLINRQLADQPTYQLGPATLIAFGEKRECHVHPHQAHLCIKVPRFADTPTNQAPTFVEWLCSWALNQRGVPTRHRASSHGWVQTNYGAGLVMDRVLDADQQPASTLFEYIRDHEPDDTLITTMYEELKTWIFRHAVPVSDLNVGNLLVHQSQQRPYLVLVDGVGGQAPGPAILAYRWWPSLIRRALKRHWPALEKRAYRQVEKARMEIPPDRPHFYRPARPGAISRPL